MGVSYERGTPVVGTLVCTRWRLLAIGMLSRSMIAYSSPMRAFDLTLGRASEGVRAGTGVPRPYENAHLPRTPLGP